MTALCAQHGLVTPIVNRCAVVAVYYCPACFGTLGVLLRPGVEPAPAGTPALRSAVRA